jgi:hypothetical protein
VRTTIVLPGAPGARKPCGLDECSGRIASVSVPKLSRWPSWSIRRLGAGSVGPSEKSRTSRDEWLDLRTRDAPYARLRYANISNLQANHRVDRTLFDFETIGRETSFRESVQNQRGASLSLTRVFASKVDSRHLSGTQLVSARTTSNAFTESLPQSSRRMFNSRSYCLSHNGRTDVNRPQGGNLHLLRY